MLRSIVRQLVCSPVPDKVQKLWDDHYRGHTEPPSSELLDATEESIVIHEHTFLVLDALDEYPVDTSPGRSTLLDTVRELLKISQKRLHLIVTSRREPDIRKVLQPMVRFVINVDQALEGDVEKLVNHALSHELIKRWGAELTSLATHKLLHSEERYVYLKEHVFVKTKHVNRRFRWTDLQIKRLRVCATADDFRDALNTLPKSLEETYHQALETIPDVHRERMRRVLIWLTSSLRELTSSEVAAVIAFPFVEDVLRICTSVLITVIDGDTRETIKLAHFTVKEFLIVQESFEVGLHWYQFSAQLANCCITAQALDSVFGLPPAGSRSLLGYASQFWPAHARHLNASPGCADSNEVQSRIDSLFGGENRKHFLGWFKEQFPSEKNTGQPLKPLYYASLLGLKRSVAQFWKNCSQLDQRKGFYGNALEAAACMGHAEVVVWLTDRIENPPSHFDLPRIARHLHTNVSPTLRALFRKGPKPYISTEVVYALVANSMGEAILKILLEENMAFILLTEELVCAAAHNKWNRKIVEFLVRNRTREFPVSLRALLTVAGTSHSALQFLVDSRKGDIVFKEQDYLELAREKSAYTIQNLVNHGVAIPVTTKLIQMLAVSPSGSQILKFLLDTQTIENPLTKLNVLTVAKGFNLETFESLLEHRWEDNVLTEELISALASNCYLDPPVRTKIPEREIRAGGLVHFSYRPTLKRSSVHSASKALIALMDGKEQEIRLDGDIMVLVTENFTNEVMLRVLNRLVGRYTYQSIARLSAELRVACILEVHVFNIVLLHDTTRFLAHLEALKEVWKLLLMIALDTTYSIDGYQSDPEPSADAAAPIGAGRAADALGVSCLPEAIQPLQYSSVEYDEPCIIHVQQGRRVSRALELKINRTFDYENKAEDDTKIESKSESESDDEDGRGEAMAAFGDMLLEAPRTLRRSSVSAGSSTRPGHPTRQTLSEGERRLMCKYAENQPTAEWKEIGCKFLSES
jgi:hypothetical protein